MAYRLIVPVSPIRLSAIEDVKLAYQRSQITRKECNRRVRELQRMKEADLEMMFVPEQHNPVLPQPYQMPAPRQRPAPRVHPREAFDIPSR